MASADARITVFPARRIITMDPNRPSASVIAVREGRVLAVGEPEDLRPWLERGRFEVDDRLADKVVLPGFIEAHMHAQGSGLRWRDLYVGFWERSSPTGAFQPGLKRKADVLARLAAAVARAGAPRPLLAWGYDPMFLGGEILSAADLDAVAGDHPVYVVNASGHLAYANSAMFALAGIDAGTTVEGIMHDAAGALTGELREGGMAPFRRFLGELSPDRVQTATLDAARLAHRAGVTTMTEWSWGALPGSVDAAFAAGAEPAMLARFVGAPLLRYLLDVSDGSLAGAIEVYRRLQARANDMCAVGPVKVFRDGSIQGFTATLRWPGYLTRDEPGMTLMSEAELRAVAPIHAAGLQVAIHTNGDAATETALGAIRGWQLAAPRLDSRHILEHNQLATDAQFREMAALGVVTNLFANHLYYWGDVHATQTVGPERANRMDNCAAALRYGVPFAIHCDDPVTPVGPLFTAWCAANRVSHSGRVLGADLRLPVFVALRAITLGAAYVLRQDGEKGSLEVGKLADFTVLDADPLEVAPAELKDVPIWGTVLGGRVQPIEPAAG